MALLAGLWLALAGGVAHAQAYSRSETITYYDNTAKWVLGQTASVTCTMSVPASTACDGDVVSSTTFDANTALPLTSSSFGKLQQTLTYNADGTLATVKDGNNNVTTLSNWKRGVAQNIKYADNTVESTTVNDNGWITSVTDENGYVTGYGYDAMGRLASIAYPTGDSVAWANTTQVFEPVAAAEYGIPAGHWRQTVSTGNARKITYFDALWRPLVKREYDAADVAGTQRFQRFAYDHDGRTTFASYPGATDALTTGTWIAYDALGRVTSVSQDSEHGLLTTLTEYLSGFRTRVTDPKGNQTTASHLTYDQPSTDWPVAISHPEGAITEISRDAFGKLTTIKRRNSDSTIALTRSYAYNANQELCRTVEPETGASLSGYDAAGNLKWSAAGLASATACETGGTSATVAPRRVDRSYDGRNRLARLSFPDGRGNQVWEYHPDGLPSTVTTHNDGGGAGVIVNTYAYDKRRHLVAEAQAQPNWYRWVAGYGYDGTGNLRWQSYPTGMVLDYAPNALGQPTQVRASGQAYATGVRYYPNGAISQFTYGNGVLHTMTQNARHLPMRSVDNGVVSFSSRYDANGNVIEILDELRGNHYSRWMTYDNLDRLAAAGSCGFGGDCWHRFSYDSLDNIKSWSLGGVKDHRYYYDTRNRLTNIHNAAGATVVGLGYDAQGNLENKSGQAYAFDYGNRLRQVLGKEVYRYDASGRRVQSTYQAGGYALSMYGSVGQLLYTEDHRARAKALEHVYLGGSLLATRQIDWLGTPAIVRYQHTDALGSPVAVTNAAGATVERTDWEPYGAAIGRLDYDGFGYAGHLMDKGTRLTYMQQRYYDPQVGRFLSVDPVTAYATPAINFNRYWYANNSPYRFTDPDGRWVEDAIIGIPSIALGAKSLVDNVRAGNVGSAVVDAVGIVADVAAIATPGVPGGVSAGIAAARGVDRAVDTGRAASAVTDGAKGADFVVTPGGTVVPTSQSRMTEGFEAAGMQGTPLPDGKGASYAMPNGVNVRAMEPSGQAPRRASFNNSNGGPVTPDGKVVQPPRGASPAERREYVRDRTHVEQTR